jgi:hypothetical protein
VGLALIVYLLPTAILWPLVRSFEKSVAESRDHDTG